MLKGLGGGGGLKSKKNPLQIMWLELATVLINLAELILREVVKS